MFLVWIETIGRLIEDEHLGIMQDRLGQTDTALEAFREGFNWLFQHAIKVESANRIIEALAARVGRDVAYIGDEAEKLAHAHVTVAGRTFGQIANHTLGLNRLGLDIKATDFCAA